jgi:D-glycero-D-manno-heptose 1,7-bisphosphate phosphatase
VNAEKRRAVFLDRDGTVIEEGHFIASPEQVRLLPGASSAIRALREAGYAVVVVTNQSGIARGLFTEEEYDGVEARVNELLARDGAMIEATYHCPHHPDFSGPCDCRKPELALYRAAERDLHLDLAASWLVGDRPADVEAASRLGARAILVRTGYGTEHERAVAADILVADDLGAAAQLILASR